MLFDRLPRIPVGDVTESAVRWVQETYRPFFRAVSRGLEAFTTSIADFLLWVPAEGVVLMVTLAAMLMAGRRAGPLVGLGFILIFMMGLWSAAVSTLALVLTAGLLSLTVGLPLGIIMSRSDRLERGIRPALDFMQTMPSFVYLIPAVILFGLGLTAGVMATFIFATPPAVRLTNLGIRQVERDAIEAATAFGSSRLRLLFRVQLPLARPTIMAGVNQTTLLALSMSVIASMIGARGLGGEVLKAIQRVDMAGGVEAGLSIVLVAIVLDRIIQGRGRRGLSDRKTRRLQRIAQSSHTSDE